MAVIIDLVICVLDRGACSMPSRARALWGAALMFFNVLFSGMIAFNFYEPVANLIDSTGIPWGFSDTLSMLGLFCISLGMLRMTTETIAPAMVRFPTPIYHLGRLVFGAGGAVVTIAIVILAFHTAPVHKKIFNTVKYDSKPPFGMGLDHQWLGFFQYETGAVFTSSRIRPARSVRGLRSHADRRTDARQGLRSPCEMADRAPGRTAVRR